MTAQKILTYWFCDNFKDTASNAIMYSVILMLVCFLFVCFCNFAIYLLCVLITRNLAIFYLVITRVGYKSRYIYLLQKSYTNG